MPQRMKKVPAGTTYALMVTDQNDLRGTALWSDSNKKLVEAEAKYRNDRLKGRGMKPRYRVEERYPVALAFVFSGTGSAYSATYAKGQERRNNGC